MSSAEVKTRFLTEEQLREVKLEEECGECEAGGADAAFEREIDFCFKEGEWGPNLLASLPRGSNGTGAKGYGARNGWVSLSLSFLLFFSTSLCYLDDSGCRIRGGF